jgi:hypothetical protein
MKKDKKKKTKHATNCGGKKCGSAFEWKIIDLIEHPQMKLAA